MINYKDEAIKLVEAAFKLKDELKEHDTYGIIQLHKPFTLAILPPNGQFIFIKNTDDSKTYICRPQHISDANNVFTDLGALLSHYLFLIDTEIDK